MIIVTGGAGFIGSNLLAALERQGAADLVVCDWLEQDPHKWRNIAKRGLYDVVEPERLFPFLGAHPSRVEAVFHLGAISATTETDGDLIVEHNINLSCRLAEWCAANRVPFFYASSAATYGDGSAGFADSEAEADLARLRPLNLYGWSKLFFDRWMVAERRKGAAMPPRWAGFRFFNVYGPNEYHKGGQKSVVCGLYPKLLAGEPARLFKSYRDGIADGEQKRDFVLVDDCVSAMLHAWRAPSFASGIYNIGSGQARSFLDLAKALFAAMGQAPRIEFIEMPEALRAHYQYFTEGNLAKLRAAGYTPPMTSLEAGVARTVQDYLAAPDPYA